MAPDAVIANLLETATALLESQPSRPTPGVQIGSERFRLLMDRHGSDGWVLVLLQSENDSGSMSDAELKYGFIGVAVSDGRFHTSWSGAALAANSTLNRRDWVSVPETGDYTITLTMCLSAKEECPTTGTWVNLSAPVPVTIRN